MRNQKLQSLMLAPLGGTGKHRNPCVPLGLVITLKAYPE